MPSALARDTPTLAFKFDFARRLVESIASASIHVV